MRQTTPLPRRVLIRGADDGAEDENDGADDGDDNEIQDEDSGEEEEDESSSIKKIRGRRRWEVMGSWDRTETLTLKSMLKFCALQLRRWRNQGWLNSQVLGALQRPSGSGHSSSLSCYGSIQVSKF